MQTTDDTPRHIRDAARLRQLAATMQAGGTRASLERAAARLESGQDALPACPPNGLARAGWWRDAAALREAVGGADAPHCRQVADAIESRELGGRPLLRIMGEGE